MIIDSYVRYYKTLTLKELRKRQNLTKQQIRTAYKSKNTKALIKLQNIEDSLTEAVMLTQFNDYAV